MSDDDQLYPQQLTLTEIGTLTHLASLAERLAEYAEPTADAADVVDDEKVVEDVWYAVRERIAVLAFSTMRRDR